MRVASIVVFALVTIAANLACGPSIDEPAPPTLGPGRYDPRPYVWITGQVQRPGCYEMAAPTTIVALIVGAGGFTANAIRRHVRLTRVLWDGRSVSVLLDVDAIARGVAADVPLYPGDVVHVPESGI